MYDFALQSDHFNAKKQDAIFVPNYFFVYNQLVAINGELYLSQCVRYFDTTHEILTSHLAMRIEIFEAELADPQPLQTYAEHYSDRKIQQFATVVCCLDHVPPTMGDTAIAPDGSRKIAELAS